MLEVVRPLGRLRQARGAADVALNVGRGEIVAILGANGAGKTTLLKAIAGLVAPCPARASTLGRHEPRKLPPHEIVEAGIALVPEGRGIFGELTVRENLLLGAYAGARACRRGANAGDACSACSRASRSASRQHVRTMSGGEQQMVAIGRALMSAPEILLLDEPSLGLSPLLCQELFRRSPASARPASASCWSSRTPSRAWPSPTAATSSRPAASSARAARRSADATIPRCSAPISAARAGCRVRSVAPEASQAIGRSAPKRRRRSCPSRHRGAPEPSHERRSP